MSDLSDLSPGTSPTPPPLLRRLRPLSSAARTRNGCTRHQSLASPVCWTVLVPMPTVWRSRHRWSAFA
jgi:hypothetical protein